MSALPEQPGDNRPIPLPVNVSGIPDLLRGRPQWVLWRYARRDGKWTKEPVNARSGKRASSTNPATWSPFEEAVIAYQIAPANMHIAGIGYVFTKDDPFTGVDLDDCIDASGHLVASAKDIVETLDSYAETSPGGRGVKIFIMARKPKGSRCRSKAIPGLKEVEIYDRERFFAVSGAHFSSSPLTIEPRQTQLEALCHRCWPPAQPKLRLVGSPDIEDDEELIELAKNAKNGHKFARLFAGDTSGHGGDDSAADLALCNLLAFWTGRDAGRIDRLFRRSGLFREKWQERRGDTTYGARTIQTAIESCKDVYEPRKASASSTAGEDGALAHYVLGETDPDTGRLILSPQRTLPTARAYVKDFHEHPLGRTLLSYGGLFFKWRDNCYREVEEDALRHRVQPWLHRAVQPQRKRNGDEYLIDFNDNPGTVNAAVESVRTYVHIPVTHEPPCWLGESSQIAADEVLCCKSCNVHIPTGSIYPPTPALFTFNALDFDYQEEPDSPECWFNFLDQIFGDDIESLELLQEWMGYTLTCETSQQKMLMLVGPRRSGKGTIGRVQSRLVGLTNVVGPTISSLAQNFGLQPLIGKSLAIVSDARFSGDKIAVVVERLLCISGEDTITIDRKYRSPVSLKLPTRFMFLTNELPDFSDASNALAGRFLILRLTKSFYDTEDTGLTRKLICELPGILRWAIEGWRRLRARGHFVQPESARGAIHDLEDLSSPVSAFVRDSCVVKTGLRVTIDDIYARWRRWCEEGGIPATSKQTFGRDLTAAVPGVHRRRGAEPFYEGIALLGGAK